MRGKSVWDADRLQAALNVLGGAAFAAGSLLFLDRTLVRLGVVFFVVGSFGMLFGALAVWHERYAPPRDRRAARRNAGASHAPDAGLDADAAAALAPEPIAAHAGAVGVTSPAALGSSPGSRLGD